MQVLPESQTVQPVQFVPPHWAHLAAVQPPGVAVADAEEAVLVAGALEVVDAAEVVVLDGAAEEEPPPDEPVGGSQPCIPSTTVGKYRLLTSGSDRGRQAAGLDVHPGEVEVLVAVRVPAPGQLEHTEVPVGAIAARAGADGGHGQLEGV